MHLRWRPGMASIQFSNFEHYSNFGFYTFWIFFYVLHVFIDLSIYLWFVVCLSVRLFVCLSVRLFVCSSVSLFVCLSVCLSVCLFVCLSVCLLACLLACLSFFILHLFIGWKKVVAVLLLYRKERSIGWSTFTSLKTSWVPSWRKCRRRVEFWQVHFVLCSVFRAASTYQSRHLII